MSLPTRIYLAFVAIAVAGWLALSNFGPSRTLHVEFHSGVGYSLQHRDRLPGRVGGRVVLDDGTGPGRSAIPPASLWVKVRARGHENGPDEQVAVGHLVPVGADGTFEVSGLPAGLARISVELSSGEVVWEKDDVAIDPMGLLNPPIDPIDLTGILALVRLGVTDPDGEPATSGAIAWRPSGGASEDVTFGGVARIEDGETTLLCTSRFVDAISLVPGAAVELFDSIQSGHDLQLGPGTSLRLRVTGELPDPARWTVRALLVPVELDPTIHLGNFSMDGARAAEGEVLAAYLEAPDRGADPEEAAGAVAHLPVVRSGRYALRWFAQRAHGRSHSSVKLLDPGGDILLPAGAGVVEIERPFPLEAFAVQAASLR